jgi:hypothetical protein
LAAALALTPSIAAADDWVVTKLRGSAAVLVGEKWQPLHRGDVVSDDRAIQTLSGGRATLERGPEKIELGPETAIRIDDAVASRYTTVKQYFGAVTVEAEVQNVEHFGVLTPHLAAVVKGTRFTVVSNKTTATVEVLRGHVAVEDSDTHQTTLLAVGQSASTSDGGAPLSIDGEGTLPVVYGANGRPVRGDVAKADTVAVKDAGTSAREDALGDGATAKEADRAAKAAEREAKEAAKESRSEAKAAEKQARAEEKAAEKEAKSESKGSDNNGSNGSSGNSGSSGNGGGSDSGNSGGGGNSAGSDSGGDKGKKDKD